MLAASRSQNPDCPPAGRLPPVARARCERGAGGPVQIRVRSGRRRKYTHVRVTLELHSGTRAARLKPPPPRLPPRATGSLASESLLPRSNFPRPVHTISLRGSLVPCVSSRGSLAPGLALRGSLAPKVLEQ